MPWTPFQTLNKLGMVAQIKNLNTQEADAERSEDHTQAALLIELTMFLLSYMGELAGIMCKLIHNVFKQHVCVWGWGCSSVVCPHLAHIRPPGSILSATGKKLDMHARSHAYTDIYMCMYLRCETYTYIKCEVFLAACMHRHTRWHALWEVYALIYSEQRLQGSHTVQHRQALPE